MENFTVKGFESTTSTSQALIYFVKCKKKFSSFKWKPIGFFLEEVCLNCNKGLSIDKSSSSNELDKSITKSVETVTILPGGCTVSPLKL